MTYSTQGGSNNGPVVTPGGIGGGGSSGFAPLVANVEYWVDSATGNDANSGAMATPWATLQRALDERAKYGELRAEFLIHLVGAGPYSMNRFEGSFAGENGRFEIRGDITADTVYISSTFTGGFAGTGVVPVTAGLGSDTQARRFMRVTSGALAGCEYMVVENTDTSITVAGNYPNITAALGDVVNGDTFDIYTPGTFIDLPVVNSTSLNPKPGFFELSGGATVLRSGYLDYPKHWLRSVCLRAPLGVIEFVNSALGYCGVQVECAYPVTFGGYAQYGLSLDGFGGASGGLLYGSGINWATTDSVYLEACQAIGYAHHIDARSIYVGSLSTEGVFRHAGGRTGYIVAVGSGVYYASVFPNPANYIGAKALWAQQGGKVYQSIAVTLRMTSNNSPLRILQGGLMLLNGSIVVIPLGTNPLINITQAGNITFYTVPTGLTPTGTGNDIKITTQPSQPTTALSADGDSVFDAAIGAVVCVRLTS